jgi:hypothetical protein
LRAASRLSPPVAAEAIAVVQDHRALEQVGELPHVARPRLAREQLGSFGGERGRSPAVTRGDLAEQVARESGRSVARSRAAAARSETPPAGREVGAEAPGPHHRAQVAVGGRNHARVGTQRLAAADALEGPLLEHAQHLGLHRERQLADLVEEDRAAARQLEAARSAAGRRR